MVERKPVQFLELLRHLVQAEIDFIIVGGVAAVLEGAPVSTFDLDIVYSTADDNVERLDQVLGDLNAIYVDPGGRRIRPDAERLRHGGHHLFRTGLGRLDALASIGDGLTFEDLVADSAERSIHGMQVSVLTLPALISSKEAANRPKDRAVLDLLRETLAQRGPTDDG